MTLVTTPGAKPFTSCLTKVKCWYSILQTVQLSLETLMLAEESQDSVAASLYTQNWGLKNQL